jgi:hypothetical protein
MKITPIKIFLIIFCFIVILLIFISILLHSNRLAISNGIINRVNEKSGGGLQATVDEVGTDTVSIRDISINYGRIKIKRLSSHISLAGLVSGQKVRFQNASIDGLNASRMEISVHHAAGCMQAGRGNLVLELDTGEVFWQKDTVSVKGVIRQNAGSDTVMLENIFAQTRETTAHIRQGRMIMGILIQAEGSASIPAEKMWRSISGGTGAKAEGTMQFIGTFRGPVKDPDFSGKISAPKVDIGKACLENLESEVDKSNGSYTFKDLKMKIGGGEVSGGMQISPTGAALSYVIDVSLQGIDLNQLNIPGVKMNRIPKGRLKISGKGEPFPSLSKKIAQSLDFPKTL